MKKLYLIITFLYAAFYLTIQAQTIYKVPPPQVIPSSPQSQVFEKYLNHKVTEYNGLPQITIPLYEINIDGLKIPVNLSYHAGGIKFGQYDGDVGAGWSINTEGYRIARTVYGKTDESSIFYDEDVFLQHINSNEDPYDRDTYLASIACVNNPFMTSTNYDGEYDQFTYMLPSTEGHFIITDRTSKSVDIIENNADKIILDDGKALALKDMKITDKGGFNYYFGTEPDGILLSEYPSTSPINHRTGWPLKQIVAPNNDRINFQYRVYPINLYSNENLQAEDARKEEYNFSVQATRYASVGEVDYQDIYKNFLLIDEIRGDNTTIKFVRNDQRIPYLITEVHISTKAGTLIRKILFEYKISPEGANINSDRKTWHNLLKSVSIGEQMKTEKKFVLDYYEPPFSCGSPDQWGYYTNQSFDCNKSHFHKAFQKLTIASSSHIVNGTTNYFMREKLGEFLSHYGTLYRYNWPDRSVNNVTPNFYSLKKITFPAGGTTEYIYEPHQFKTSSNLVISGGGQRIKRIISRNENKNPIITQFQYGNNENGIGIANLELSPVNFTDYSYQMVLGTPNTGTPIPYYTFSQVKRYSTVPVLPDMSNFQVNYEQVSTTQYDSIRNTYNGKSISVYAVPLQYSIGYWQNYCTVFYFERDSIYYRIPNISVYRIGEKPLLMNRSVYNESSELIQKETYTYLKNHLNVYSGLKIAQKAFFNIYLKSYNSYLYHYGYLSSLFDYMNYSIETGINRLAEKTTTQYKNGTEITVLENFEYDAKNQVIKETKSNSVNSGIETFYTYPYNYTESIYNDMVNKNMISHIIEKYSKQNNKEIGRIKTTYTKDPNITTGLILPASIQTSFSGIDGLFENVIFNRYDEKGNILKAYYNRDGTYVNHVWAYNSQYPVAKIESSTNTTISVTVNDNNLSKSDQINSVNSDITYLKGLLSGYINNPNYIVTLYTYKPLIGMTSQTDPNGVTTYYEYDSFGRLKCTKDDDGNILKQYDYHYSNQ